MIIDFHTHVFPDKIAQRTIEALSQKADIPPYSDGTVDGLLSTMGKAGVEIAVNLPVITNPAQFESVNRFAAEISRVFTQSGRGILSFAGIHPACEALEEKMRWIRENGFLGVKIHPDYQGTFIDHPSYIRILECARDLDLIVVTHAGVDGGFRGHPICCPPDRVKRVIRKVPHTKFVLAHCGANEMADEVLQTLCDEDVYFDTSYVLRFIEEDIFRQLVARHGDDRMLFGSDSPWSDMANDVKILKSYSFQKSTEEKLLYQNAATLLGINTGE